MIRFLPPSKLWLTARCLLQNRRRGEGIYPFYASFKVTDRCGFHCSFCNVWRNPASDLDTEGVVKVLENLGRSSVILTSIEGGEPLLRKDIGTILEVASRQPFYLLFTTSVRDVLRYPWDRYSRWIDLFHLSIDEGHDNLELFDALPDLVRHPWIVCVQTVVRRQDLETMTDKVRRCAAAGAKILLMPAVELDGASRDFPDAAHFHAGVSELKRQYPETVLTPRRYLDALIGESDCSAASVIIDSDGGLFYPCRTLGEKPVNLTETELLGYVESEDARQRREEMHRCPRRCGWYQYFAIDFFTAPGEAIEALRPYWGDLLGFRRRGYSDGKRYDALETSRENQPEDSAGSRFSG